MENLDVTTKGNFTVFFDTVKKTITIKNAAYLRPLDIVVYNNTIKGIIYDRTIVGSVASNDLDIVITTTSDLSGMANTNDIHAIIKVDLNEMILSRLTGLSFREIYTIIPDDNADIPEGMGYICPFLAGGNVSVITAGGQSDIIALDLKEIFPLKIKRVKNTNTTATGIRMLR